MMEMIFPINGYGPHLYRACSGLITVMTKSPRVTDIAWFLYPPLFPFLCT